MAKNLPLIRLSAINPFLMELHRREKDAASLLRALGLPEQIPASHELFVAPTAIYEFVERSAQVAGDQYLGYQVGMQLELHRWDPIAASAKQANTVGELMTQFSLHAADHSSATRFFLHTDGEKSTFGLERLNPPPFSPGQNDAFYFGFLSRLLRQATRDQWVASGVLFRVADPACIPSTPDAKRIAAGGNRGMQMVFPTQWLFERFEMATLGGTGVDQKQERVPQSLIASLHRALEPHLHESDLTVDRASSICGYDRRRLARELRAAGTTLSREIARLRARRAEQELAGSKASVAEIAKRVGYSDPTVFSRAFKNWTGQSPAQFRRAHRP